MSKEPPTRLTRSRSKEKKAADATLLPTLTVSLPAAKPVRSKSKLTIHLQQAESEEDDGVLYVTSPTPSGFYRRDPSGSDSVGSEKTLLLNVSSSSSKRSSESSTPVPLTSSSTSTPTILPELTPPPSNASNFCDLLDNQTEKSNESFNIRESSKQQPFFVRSSSPDPLPERKLEKASSASVIQPKKKPESEEAPPTRSIKRSKTAPAVLDDLFAAPVSRLSDDENDDDGPMIVDSDDESYSRRRSKKSQSLASKLHQRIISQNNKPHEYILSDSDSDEGPSKRRKTDDKQTSLEQKNNSAELSSDDEDDDITHVPAAPPSNLMSKIVADITKSRFELNRAFSDARSQTTTVDEDEFRPNESLLHSGDSSPYGSLLPEPESTQTEKDKVITLKIVTIGDPRLPKPAKPPKPVLFKILTSHPIERIVTFYCQSKNLRPEDVVFRYKNVSIFPKITPQSLRMQDKDTLYVCTRDVDEYLRTQQRQNEELIRKLAAEQPQKNNEPAASNSQGGNDDDDVLIVVPSKLASVPATASAATAPQGEAVLIKINFADGSQMKLRIKKSQTMGQVISHLRTKRQLTPQQHLELRFEGSAVSQDDTAETLELEDDFVLDAVTK